jgi:hypothetical protein
MLFFVTYFWRFLGIIQIIEQFNIKKSLKIGKNAKNDEKSEKSRFLSKIVNFHLLISVANLNQNTTCYSVLESVECEQHYSDQFVVIYSTCQKLLAKNQADGTVTIVRLENYLHH